MKRVSRKSFLDKNYYAMSCYSSSRYNTFSELSAANLQVAWFFVILIFSPNKGMKCFSVIDCWNQNHFPDFSN